MELAILDWIQQHMAADWLDGSMVTISWLGNSGLVWIILAVVLFCIPKYRWAGVAVAYGLLCSLIFCNGILKPMVARLRPFAVNPMIELLIAAPTDYSFPSGHTSASFAAVIALWRSKEPLWVPAGILAVLIGFSRLYLYVHYPTDVLLGAVVGMASGWVGYHLSSWLKKKMATVK